MTIFFSFVGGQDRKVNIWKVGNPTIVAVCYFSFDGFDGVNKSASSKRRLKLCPICLGC